jgi:hypothetical protein
MGLQLSNLYEELMASLPLPVFDPLQEVKDLIADSDSLIEADDRGCNLQAGNSTYRVDLPGGLTEAHYHRLASSLFDDDKVVLALAVIKKAIQPKTWLAWENTKTLARDLRRMAADDDYQGMLRAIDSVGFAGVVSELNAKIAKTPQTPRCKARLVWIEKPAWDGNSGVLSFGNKMWKFKLQDGPVVHLLGQLEKEGWPQSVRLAYLDPDQVREAARGLRKTRPTINWTASADGFLSWRLQ